MRVVFLATGTFPIPTLKRLIAEGVDIAHVVTQPDRPKGRGRSLAPTPVKAAALELGLSVTTAENVNDPEHIEAAESAGADVGVVIDFGQKVREEYRSAFRGGCINLHASLLPKYRGAAPFQWAILNGESSTGVTVFKLVDRMDAGPVLSMLETPLSPNETADDLHDRLAELGPSAVLDALQQFENGANPPGAEQDESLATKAPKLSKDDGLLDFNKSAEKIVRQIHGLWSWPGARCRFVSADGKRDEVVIIARAKAHVVVSSSGPSTDSPPAASISTAGALDDQLRIQCADETRLEIIEIKPQGGRLMQYKDFVNGRRVVGADQFQMA